MSILPTPEELPTNQQLAQEIIRGVTGLDSFDIAEAVHMATTRRGEGKADDAMEAYAAQLEGELGEALQLSEREKKLTLIHLVLTAGTGFTTKIFGMEVNITPTTPTPPPPGAASTGVREPLTPSGPQTPSMVTALQLPT